LDSGLSLNDILFTVSGDRIIEDVITDLRVTLIISQKEKRAAKVARSAAAVKVKPFGFASKKSSFWSPLRSAQKSIFPRKTLTSTTPWAKKAALFSFSFFFLVFLFFLFFRKMIRAFGSHQASKMITSNY